MDKHELKARCLALPGAQEKCPFGDEVPVFKVGRKMFAHPAARHGNEAICVGRLTGYRTLR